MDFKTLRKELEKSVKIYEKEVSAQKELVKKEVVELQKLLQFLMPVLPKEEINGKKAVLIYVFEESQKKTISNKVYFCEDRKIRYQVFKKDEYMSYNPTVEYDGAYAVLNVEEMFSKRNGLEFSDVVEFFAERIDALKEMAREIYASVEMREDFLENYKSLAKDLK